MRDKYAVRERNTTIAATLIVLTIFGLIGWWEWRTWQECLVTNSWFYCLRILG